jgi:hypothetical protein
MREERQPAGGKGGDNDGYRQQTTPLGVEPSEGLNNHALTPRDEPHCLFDDIRSTMETANVSRETANVSRPCASGSPMPSAPTAPDYRAVVAYRDRAADVAYFFDHDKVFFAQVMRGDTGASAWN